MLQNESILALLAEEIIKNQRLAASRVWLVHALRSAEISLDAVALKVLRGFREWPD